MPMLTEGDSGILRGSGGCFWGSEGGFNGQKKNLSKFWNMNRSCWYDGSKVIEVFVCCACPLSVGLQDRVQR